MADLSFIVDYKQIKAARAEIEKLGPTAQKAASTFETAFKKNLTSVTRQIALSKRLEAQKLREAKASATAANLVAKEEERLKNKFVEGYTAMNIYTKELNDLAVARKRGIITTKEQTAAVAQLNAQMKAGTGVFANAATGMQVVGKRANRTGVLAQQAGYQFGDFAVQVQSGTNPMVAFGQQATQLIGTFSMLAKSTKAIVAFSALGVIVPVLTAVGAYFMRAKDAAKSFEGSTFDVNEAAKTATEDLKKYREELALLASEYKTLGEVGIEGQIKNLTDELASLEGRRDQIIRSALSGFGASGGMMQSADLQRMVSRALAENTAEINAQILAKRQQLYQLTLERESLETAKRLLGEQNELITEGANATLRRNRNSRQAIIDMEAELSLKQEIARYGEESVEVARYRAEQEAIAKNLTEESAQRYVELAVESYKVQMQIDASADSAKNFADALKEAASAMSSLSSFGDSLDKALAVSLAKVQALKAGADATVAGSIAGMRADLSSRVQQGLASGVPIGTIMAEIDSSSSIISQLEASETQRKALEEANRKSSGGDKKEQRLESFIASIQTEREALSSWYMEQNDLLAQFNESELAVVGGHAEAKLRLEKQYSDRLIDLKKSESSILQDSARRTYDALGNFLSVFAGKSKAAAIASIALSKALSIAEAINNTAVAYTYALRYDPTGVLSARVAALGKIQIGLIAATGLAQAASVGRGGSSSSASGGGFSSSGADAAIPTQGTATPQRVIIEGIDRDSLITGEQLSNIFEALYKENENRGFVFEVAR